MIESPVSDITQKLECLDSTVGNKESSLSTPSNGEADVEDERLEVPGTFEETGDLYNIYDWHTLYKEVWELQVIEEAKKYSISDGMILPGIGPSISKISFGQYWSALCYHHYKDGSKCEQKGKVLDEEFFDALYERIINVDPNILQEIELQGRGYNDTKTMIAVTEQELQKHKRALDKLYESYEEDLIMKQVFMERKVVRTRQIQKLEGELQDLRKVVVEESSHPTMEQIVKRIGQFRELWSEAVTSEEKNRALKKLVERVVYNREEDWVELTVCYK